MATTTPQTPQAGWLAERWNSLRQLPKDFIRFPKALINYQALLWIIAAVAIVVDQATKWWVEANIPLYDAIVPIASLELILDFLHVKNPGAAFGTGQEYGWVFTIIAFAVCGFILLYNSIILEKYRPFRVSLGLILGGALGNVIDRFRIGEVTDFIHFDFTPLASDWLVERVPLLNFAIFNLADLFIFSGVCIMFWLMWKDDLPEDPWTEEAPVPAADAALGSRVLEDRMLTTAAISPSIQTDDYRLRFGRSTAAYQADWRQQGQNGRPAEEPSTSEEARFGLRAAILLGIGALLVVLFIFWRKQSKKD